MIHIFLILSKGTKFFGMTEKELFHSELIRDADKMDSFRAKIVDDIYTMANITVIDIRKCKVSDFFHFIFCIGIFIVESVR